MSGRWRPVGQHRKRLVAGTTAPAANADVLVPLVMRLFAALAVTDDGPLATKRAQPREQLQRDLDHPGSALFSDGSAMKRTTADARSDRTPSSQTQIEWRALRSS